MQRVNEYRFYELGQKIRSIQSIDQHSPYVDVWYQLWEARGALIELANDPVSLRVSSSVVNRLLEAISAIVPLDHKEIAEKLQESQGSPSPPVGWPAYELGEALKVFEPVLSAECKALDTYVVSQKRGYSIPDLVDKAHVMLGEDAIATLSDAILSEVKAAGRCLAFDVPTAAGFHILRAVEAVMGQYYKHLTGKTLKAKNRNWGAYLKALQDEPMHDPKIHGALDHIRQNYRNPISHPEDTLSESNALMLFALSLSTIELMSDTLRNTNPALSPVEQATALAEIAETSAPDF